MKIGIIGLGDIATKAYLPVLASKPDITLLLCTRNEKQLKALSQQYRIPDCFTSHGDLIASKPDVIFIHSATDSHYAVAKASLDAGIATFIDKPISYAFNEAEDLVEFASQKHLQLHVGFNRRFTPLYQDLFRATPIHAYYQKNRHNLPDDPRVFVFDDFIHVIDTLLYMSQGRTQELNIQPQFVEDKLASIWVNWRHDGRIFTAEMNRINALLEERLQFSANNEKWIIDNLSEGKYYKDKHVTGLQFNDWEPTLKKRGFVDMIDHVLASVQQNSPCDYESILATHRLCEIIVQRVQQ